jgi:hypothetical protein
MKLLIGVAALGILTWALGAGVFTRKAERAKIFSGLIGRILAGIIIVVSVALLWFAFFTGH